MEEHSPSNVKVALTNGIFLGVVLIVFSLIMWIIGVPREHWLQYLSFIIMLAGVVVALKNYREKCGGLITYGQAFTNGFLTVLFASILTSVYIFLFFQVLAPAELEKMLELAEEQMIESDPNLSDEELELAMGYTKMFMKPWTMALWALLFNVIAGLIIAAIAAAFMKKEDQSVV